MTRREAPISPPVVLTIAGSDSGGGAGIQADLKTIEACGGFGTSAITSVTAQNTLGVQGSQLLPIDHVAAQIDSVTGDFDVAAVKTGMLATSDVIELVVDHAADLPALVVDPVMVAASGDRLLAEAAEDAYESLVAAATLVTPNTDEAEVLTGVTVDDPAAAERAGRVLVAEQGADAALVKGGHLGGDHVVDTLVRATDGERRDDADGGRRDGGHGGSEDGLAVTTFRHDRVETDATHGSGCTLSSAIATRLAHGDGLEAAVGAGIDLLSRAVRYNADVGQGPGSVHHLVELRNDASRQPTVDLVRTVATRVDAAGWDSLCPSAGIGLAGTTPHAEEPGDVAAVPDRLTPSGDDGTAGARAATRKPTIPVAFGADDPLASVLLAAREADPGHRLAALVAVDPDRPGALEDTTATVDWLASHLDESGPIPADLAADVTAAAESAVALAVPVADGEQSLSIVFGESPATLLDRLAALTA